MVAARRHLYTNSPVAARESRHNYHVPLTLEQERYSPEVTVNTAIFPPEQLADANRDSDVVNNLVLQAERVYLGGFWQGKLGHTANCLEDGMQQTMLVTNAYEALRVFLRHGDPDLEFTIYTDFTKDSDTDAAEASVVEPSVLFSLRWVPVLYTVPSSVTKCPESVRFCLDSSPEAEVVRQQICVY